MNDLRTLSPVWLLSLLFVACGVASAGRDATLDSALEFREVFLDELRTAGNVTIEDQGEGRSGSAYTRSSTYHLPPNSMTPAQVIALANDARLQWGRAEQYASHGTGTSGLRYELHYGNDDSHVFIDIRARLGEGEVIEVECLMRVLE